MQIWFLYLSCSFAAARGSSDRTAAARHDSTASPVRLLDVSEDEIMEYANDPDLPEGLLLNILDAVAADDDARFPRKAFTRTGHDERTARIICKAQF